MQVREQYLALAQQAAFGELGFLHFHDEVGIRKDVLGFGGNLGASGLVVRVLEANTGAGAGLDQDLVSCIDQLSHACGYEPNPILVNFYFFRDANFHGSKLRGCWGWDF
jgi:hypothetical protein